MESYSPTAKSLFHPVWCATCLKSLKKSVYTSVHIVHNALRERLHLTHNGIQKQFCLNHYDNMTTQRGQWWDIEVYIPRHFTADYVLFVLGFKGSKIDHF